MVRGLNPLTHVVFHNGVWVSVGIGGGGRGGSGAGSRVGCLGLSLGRRRGGGTRRGCCAGGRVGGVTVGARVAVAVCGARCCCGGRCVHGARGLHRGCAGGQVAQQGGQVELQVALLRGPRRLHNLREIIRVGMADASVGHVPSVHTNGQQLCIHPLPAR